MKQKLWIERRFVFDTPASLFPALLERLRGTPARVEERIRALGPELLVKRDGETWSIQENIGHLLVVESLWHGRMDDFTSGVETLRAADMENHATKDAGFNSKPLVGILTGFRTSRSRFVARLEASDEVDVERSAMHPRLDQPMRVIDMVVFAAEHDDHHLARITELMRLLEKGR